MEITVNGKRESFDGITRLSELIELLGFQGKRFAVEHNGEVVMKDSIDHLELKNGDRVEIVSFVGGG